MPPRPATDLAALRETLISHAQTIVERDGADRLTMRALASEAGCALGLPYKAFPTRDDLMRELATRALADMSARLDAWRDRADGDLGERLDEFADILLASTAPALADQVSGGLHGDALTVEALESGAATSWEHVVAEFLRRRQLDGVVAADVDPNAYGFLITGAIHNLLVSGDAYPRPTREQLRGLLAAVARHLSVTAGAPAGAPSDPTHERGTARPRGPRA